MNITLEMCLYLTTGTSFLDAYSLVNDEGDDGEKALSKTTVATYARLQRQSPMTLTIASNRYRTNHRVLGNIVNALINLQKYTVSRFLIWFLFVFFFENYFLPTRKNTRTINLGKLDWPDGNGFSEENPYQ